VSPAFSPELLAAIRDTVGRYPERRAALLPVLHLVQNALGHVSPDSEREVAGLLGLEPVQVREATTFYSMIRPEPAGRFHLQVCVNLTCSLLGGRSLVDLLQERIGLKPGGRTADGLFSLAVMECLGACEQAPCLMVNEERYGNMDADKLSALLDRLRADHV